MMAFLSATSEKPGAPRSRAAVKPADNARPLTAIRLSSGAVATSGAYARGVKIGGRLYSHIIDPRSGYPAEGSQSITVIHTDAASADAA